MQRRPLPTGNMGKLWYELVSTILQSVLVSASYNDVNAALLEIKSNP